MTKETKLILRNVLLIIITAGLYLIWLFRNSDSEFVPVEEMNDKD